MRAEQFGEDRGLGLTEFRELGGDMRHRAVMLADLHSVADLPGVGGVPGTGQRVGDLLDRVGDGHRVGTGRHIGDDPFDTLPREVGDGFVPAEVTEFAHRGTGEVVIGMAHLAAPPPV